jgi:hypothetical protein
MNVTARVTRSGDWWAIEVPDIPGLFTQARRLDQVVPMVRDAAKLLGAGDVGVAVQVMLSPEAMAEVRAMKEANAEAARVQAASAEKARQVVHELRQWYGLSVRDVAQVIGVSPQRVSQLAPVHSKAAPAPIQQDASEGETVLVGYEPVMYEDDDQEALSGRS